MKKRILVFSPTHAGGVSSYLNNLEAGLGNDYSPERFFVGRRKGDPPLARFIRPLADAIRLLRFNELERYDVIHLNPSLNWPSLLRDSLFLLVLRCRGIQNCVVFFHGWSDSISCMLKANKMAAFLFKKIFETAEEVLVLSSSYRNELCSLGLSGDMIHVVTTLFDGSSLGRLEKTVPPTNGIRLLFMARFIREKGTAEVLDSFAILESQYPELRLVMAGEGPELESAKRRVDRLGLQNKIHFPGYVQGSRKAEILKTSHIFVLPTFHGEGCPVALLEAMGAGLAVVTTKRGGIPEIVDPPENGILLEDIKPRNVARAIQVFLDDPCYLNRVRENNMKKAWGMFETGVASRTIAEIYCMVARTARTRVQE